MRSQEMRATTEELRAAVSDLRRELEARAPVASPAAPSLRKGFVLAQVPSIGSVSVASQSVASTASAPLAQAGAASVSRPHLRKVPPSAEKIFTPVHLRRTGFDDKFALTATPMRRD